MNKFNQGDIVKFKDDSIIKALKYFTRSNFYNKMAGHFQIQKVVFAQDGSKDGHGEFNCTTYEIKGFDVPVSEKHLGAVE